ncbi:MAG: hypothetical protein GX823_04530 [Clostridiales bacterium]|nr:hypothetical protein [Clostridiales bacterium]
MAKAGMRRPDPKEPHGTESNKKTHIPKNDVPPVPEIQGRAKSGKVRANPIADSVQMSTAEILDFAEGSDSY